MSLSSADRAIFEWVIHHRIAMLNTPLWALSQVAAGGMLWLAIALALRLMRHISTWGLLQVALAVAVASAVANEVVKPLVDRTRPLAVDAAELIGKLPATPSFPSGHAANAFAAALVLGALLPRAALPFYALAALVAFSRVYLGVHYPFDIAAGTIIGLMSGAIVRAVAKRWDLA